MAEESFRSSFTEIGRYVAAISHYRKSSRPSDRIQKSFRGDLAAGESTVLIRHQSIYCAKGLDLARSIVGGNLDADKGTVILRKRHIRSSKKPLCPLSTATYPAAVATNSLCRHPHRFRLNQSISEGRTGRAATSRLAYRPGGREREKQTSLLNRFFVEKSVDMETRAGAFVEARFTSPYLSDEAGPGHRYRGPASKRNSKIGPKVVKAGLRKGQKCLEGAAKKFEFRRRRLSAFGRSES